MSVLQLTCYRIAPKVGGVAIESADDCLDAGDRRVRVYGPVTGPDFDATLFVADTFPQEPRWGGLLRGGFGDDLDLPRTEAAAALLIVDVGRDGKHDLFAFAFGPGGRHLLREDVYVRGYGLRTALNVLYPRKLSGDDADLARLRAMDSKHRTSTVMRARVQASEASTFETFDLNRLRDVVNSAVGVPPETAWGPRIGGGDALSLTLDHSFDEFGTLCRRINATHRKKDYRDRFAWVDDMQPVTDGFVISDLERELFTRLSDGTLQDLALSPPEVVDWDRVAGFRYPFDPRRPRGQNRPVMHPDLRIETLHQGLVDSGGIDELGAAYVRQRYIEGVDGNGDPVHRWSIWRCLVAEIDWRGRSYVLDEGEFFLIDRSYLAELNRFVDAVPATTLSLPPTRIGTHEDDYNKAAAASSPEFLLMDRKNVKVSTATTPIELCDILTTDRRLVHIKRHLGSSDLSHLFAQGVVSAELLQGSPEFRAKAQERVNGQAAGRAGFEHFAEAALVTSEFEVVYGVIERWSGRSLVTALPFFSKVNLRLAIENLASRGYNYSFSRIEATL